jgi:hypothetical protein
MGTPLPVGVTPAGGQKKRPIPERRRRVTCHSLIYFAYLVKKFNLKILTPPWPGVQPAKILPSTHAPKDD